MDLPRPGERRTHRIQAELAVDVLTDRVIDPGDDSRNLKDLERDLGGHDVAVIALGKEAKPSADSMPAWRSTSSSMPLPSTISPGKSLPRRSKARRLLSITVTWWPSLERARAAMAPTRPHPTITSFMK